MKRIMQEFCLAVVGVISFSVSAADPIPPYACQDAVPEVKGRATGYFHVERLADGKWWGIDPKGRGFLFKAVQSAHVNGCNDFLTNRRPYQILNRRRWPSTAAWETNCIERLQGWGFNMLGQGCAPTMAHRGLVHARQLDLGFSFANLEDPDCAIVVYRGRDNACSSFPNVFSPAFADHCRRRAAELCAPSREDPWLVGWYLDNELLWRGDLKINCNPRSTGIYETVVRLPKTHSARQSLDAYLAERGWKPGMAVTLELKKGFLMRAAEKYFSITTAAVREADPNHMILGARFAGIEGCADYDVYRPCGRYCDIMTFNCYPFVDLTRNTCKVNRGSSIPVADHFAKVAGLAGKPIMITEWSFMALDAGLPCSCGAGQRVMTQQERAQAAEVFLRQMLAMPDVVGWNYFRWIDQEPSGGSMYNREDCNYGLVNNRDEAYPIAETIGRLQNDVYRFRNSQPLEEKPARPDQGPGKMLAALRPPREVSFVRRDDGFEVNAGCGFVCAGKKGEKGPLPRMRLADQEAGSVIGLLNHFDSAGTAQWPDLGLIDSFEWEPVEDGGGRLTVELAGSSETLKYAATVRLTFTPGSSSVLFEILSVANHGEEPINVRRIYMAPSPAEMPGIRPYSCTDPLWGTLDRIDRTAWVYPDGRVLGATTRASHVAVFKFRTDGAGRKYSEIAFLPEAFNGGSSAEADRKLAPGAAWRPTVPPWLFVRATSFGEGRGIPPPRLTREEAIRIGQERAAKKNAVK